MSKQSKHLKRMAMPRSWPFPRKGYKYVTKPLPGKKIEYALPICVILRDTLKICATKKEAKKILLAKEVLVDNKIVKNASFPVGLFDIVALPRINKYYRVEFSKKGKLCIKEIPENEAYTKPCKIIGKKVLKKSKTQINLYDGKNFLYGEGGVNDSVVVDLKQNKILKLLPLKEGALVYIIRGKYAGVKGQVIEREKNFVTIKDSKQIKTVDANVFVIG